MTELNLYTKVTRAVGGAVHLEVRGANRLYETWILTRQPEGIRAERWDAVTGIAHAQDECRTVGDALRWLADSAYDEHGADSITTSPAKVARAFKEAR